MKMMRLMILALMLGLSFSVAAYACGAHKDGKAGVSEEVSE